MYQQEPEFTNLDDKPYDDIIDLINYGFILLLLKQGKWGLEWGEQADEQAWLEDYPGIATEASESFYVGWAGPCQHTWVRSQALVPQTHETIWVCIKCQAIHYGEEPLLP
jgi:hypothetical protein